MPALSAAQLRREIGAINAIRAEGFDREVSYGESTRVIYREADGSHGNSLPGSWHRIMANPLWQKRLAKSYTGWYVLRPKDRKRFELDCASSSDALLMNVFCYPRLLDRASVCGLPGIEPGQAPEFGFRPRIALINGRADRTEIDMRVGELLVEAKLTEGNFQCAPRRLLMRYRDLEAVSNIGDLPIADGLAHSWQLFRGVPAAHACSASFVVLCDRRRPDLIDRWYEVMRAASSSLRALLGVLTWQEISMVIPRPVGEFLEGKYGI